MNNKLSIVQHPKTIRLIIVFLLIMQSACITYTEEMAMDNAKQKMNPKLMKSLSTEHMPCKEKEMKLLEHRTGMIFTENTWTVKCKGKTYYCVNDKEKPGIDVVCREK